MANLAAERCEACEGGVPPLSVAEAKMLLSDVADRWSLADDGFSIACEVQFKNFVRAMDFLNRVAEVAEQEGHHPDFCLHGWNKVSLTLSTHAIGGLSRNDFILAAKIDAVVKATDGNVES